MLRFCVCFCLVLERNLLFLRWLEIFPNLLKVLMDRRSFLARFLRCLVLPAFFISFLFPPVCLAKKVTLGWDSNPEPDVEGYVIYRNIGSPGPPYKYADELSENELKNPLSENELKNPLHPQVTITGLNEHTQYYIAVTAYDAQGNESHFSDQLCVEVVDSLIESCGIIPSTYRSSSESNAGSGSNSVSGCFISSIVGYEGHGWVAGAIVTFLGFMFIVFVFITLKSFSRS